VQRDGVLRAALDIADREGLGALTMQRVGRAVGVESMSLYRHVANKDDLLDGLVDLVYAELAPPSPGHEWRAAMRARAVDVRAALLRHPWALALMESRARPGPANLAHHDAVLACLFAAGFSPATATRAYNLIDSFVYGFVLQEKSLPFATPDEMAALAPEMLAPFSADAYPNLARVAADLIAHGFRYADEFLIGLDLVLDGIARSVAPSRSRRRQA
jgi:AcrR family transcriptional regulator